MTSVKELMLSIAETEQRLLSVVPNGMSSWSTDGALEIVVANKAMQLTARLFPDRREQRYCSTILGKFKFYRTWEEVLKHLGKTDEV